MPIKWPVFYETTIRIPGGNQLRKFIEIWFGITCKKDLVWNQMKIFSFVRKKCRFYYETRVLHRKSPNIYQVLNYKDFGCEIKWKYLVSRPKLQLIHQNSLKNPQYPLSIGPTCWWLSQESVETLITDVIILINLLVNLT